MPETTTPIRPLLSETPLDFFVDMVDKDRCMSPERRACHKQMLSQLFAKPIMTRYHPKELAYIDMWRKHLIMPLDIPSPGPVTERPIAHPPQGYKPAKTKPVALASNLMTRLVKSLPKP